MGNRRREREGEKTNRVKEQREGERQREK